MYFGFKKDQRKKTGANTADNRNKLLIYRLK